MALTPAELEALANARLAVEHDPVRRAALIADARLGAAVILAGRVEVAEALLSGVPVPVRRLHPAAAAALDLEPADSVELDYWLALRVLALGPLTTDKPKGTT